MTSHSNLIEEARRKLVRSGATEIEVLDGLYTGRGSKWRAPVPDIICRMSGKKVAVECGYLANKDRFAQLKTAGYEVVIWWPYLEVFDSTMTLPSFSNWVS